MALSQFGSGRVENRPVGYLDCERVIAVFTAAGIEPDLARAVVVGKPAARTYPAYMAARQIQIRALKHCARVRAAGTNSETTGNVNQ